LSSISYLGILGKSTFLVSECSSNWSIRGLQ
jgi:hypothetical protein